jgi:uroporphyrinogen decarboxylase
VQPRERVLSTLERGQSDRVPRFEIWIDALWSELGQHDHADAYVNLGQDCIMMPGGSPPGSNAWRDGVDEFGRIWNAGRYAGGAVAEAGDLHRFTPALNVARGCFDRERVRAISHRYPHHCLIFGTHAGPLTAAYLAMGFERFFACLVDNPSLAHSLLEARTEWCIALFREASRLGAEVLVMGDDAAHRDGPMISTAMWREFVLPYHCRIVQALDAPLIWHSDGNLDALLPFAVQAGFAGVHGLEPAAGMDLGRAKEEFGAQLTLIGNVDVRVLCGSDLGAVRAEVRRCLEEGAPGGSYMMATCNSIFNGMNPVAVAELFRFQAEMELV